MNNTVIIGLFAFAAILAGALAGVEARDRLPKHHLTDETKNLVSVSTAVVATVSALVLGLLISNANTPFTRLGGQVTALSAEILRLDHILRRYGADAEPARNMLLQYAEHKATDLFPDDPADVRLSNPSTYELLQRLEDMLLALKPANPRGSMVAGSGYDPCGQDRRHPMASGPADWAGNAKSVRRSPRLLANVAVRQFWSFCAA